MVALLAILHMLVLIGFAVFLFGSGRLDAEKIGRIAAVMRGEDMVDSDAPVTSRPAAIPVVARASSEKIAELQASDAVQRSIGERLIREAADRKALVDAAMLKVTLEKESLAKQRESFSDARKLARQEDEQAGLSSEMGILSGLSEKNARDLLMKKQMPDAVAVLMRMKKRAAAGIIEACKTEQEKAWAVQVMQEIANQDEQQAKELAKATR